ncbi:MAG: PD-(D/E)XK nuclease family protein [Bacteroidales bacterium]
MKKTPFLKLVAQHLQQNYPNSLDEICLVFPSRRAITYFYKYLSECVSEPVWSPVCFTINEFYQKFSVLHVANDLWLNAQLFNIYQQIHPTAETFDHFYPWGNVLLADFDDIDKYRVDAQLLFSHIAKVKQIDELFAHFTPEQQELIARFWHNFHESKNSKEKEHFVSLWQKLYPIYEKFKNTLRQQKIAYEGMLFRDVADLFESGSVQVPYSRVGFVGLHALTECDRIVLNYFKNTGKGLFYWDYHPYFVADKGHEAGYFIRKNLEFFPSSLPREWINDGTPEHIEVISVPYRVGQTKMVENILNQIALDGVKPEDTAIILADENLLLPLLRGIPPEFADVNVTMGYSLRLTNIYTLFQQIIELHLQGTHSQGFYYKQVESILYHPFFLKLMPDWVHEFVKTIHNTNQIYIPSQTFSQLPLPIIPYLFKEMKDMEELIEILRNLCNDLYGLLFKEDEQNNEEADEHLVIEKESLQVVRTFLGQLQTVIDSIDLPISLPLGMRILMKGLGELKLAFEGEPLRGIQIMGFLETRSLDFDRVIILSANEGYLPRTQQPISFIPYTLRAANGLPTFRNRDAMYAYYFYRLLSRSSYVWMLYSTSGDQATEKSRYIRQLEWDSRYQVSFKNIAYSLETIGVAPIEIAKNAEIIDKIRELWATSRSYLSPSALATYLNCPLQFYFRYIADLKPEEEIQEKINSASLGSILHELMHQLYYPYIGKTIGEMTIDVQNLDSLIEKITRTHFGLSPHSELTASISMIVPIVKKYCELIIDFDQSHCKENKLLFLEQPYKAVIEVNERLKVGIGGRMDRIDCTPDGNIRIVDYKTGDIGSSRYKDINDLFSPNNWKKRELLQAMVYAWLFYKNEHKKSQPVLYNIQRLAEKKDIVKVDLPNKTHKNQSENTNFELEENEFETIEESIKQVINEIFDPNVKFTQTQENKLCKRCSYNQICRR